MRRFGGTFLLCLVLSGCSIIDAATGGDDDDDDDDDAQCAKTDVCYDPAETLTPPVEALQIAAGRFDVDDGTIDLAIVDAGGDIYMLLNDDPQFPGSLSEEDVTNDFDTAPDDFAAGDFDGDGVFEVLGSFTADGLLQLRTLEGAPSQTDLALAGQIAIANFNGDERDDAAIVTGADVTVLYGRGVGGFENARAVVNAEAAIEDIAAGDFDGDEDIDIAVIIGPPDSHLQILENTGPSSFTAHTAFAPCLADCPPSQREDPRNVVAGDFDGDGRDELGIVVACMDGCDSEYHKIRFLGVELDDLDQWSADRRFDLNGPIDQVRTADMDDDFFIDVMWQERRGEPVLVFLYQDYFNTSSGMPGELGVNDALVDTVLVDLNDDGLTDIAAGTETTQVDVFLTR